jgi:hypothetical protein
VRRLCLALVFATFLTMLWNCRMADTILLGINGALWSIMAQEASGQISAMRRESDDPKRT